MRWCSAERLTLALTLLAMLALQAALASEPPGNAWIRALQKRHAGEVAEMLSRTPAPDVNRATPGGITALMVAAKAGDVDLIGRLLARGARVEATSRSGGRALMFAAQSGSTKALERLLDAGAKVDAEAGNGWTALTVAAAVGDEDMTAALLDAGAEPGHRDVYGWTPLMRAAGNGHVATVRTLAPVSDLDAVDESGLTALHHAAHEGFSRVAAVLLERCADATLRDEYERTAAEMARNAGHRRLAEMIAAKRECAGS